MMWYWTKIIFLVFAGALLLWFLYEFVTFPAISRLRTENPTTSSMIEYRLSEAKAEGTEPKKFMIWTPIEQISPNLQRAVLAGEDARFFQHDGFDWEAIQGAWDEAVSEGEKEAKEECEAEAKTAQEKKDCKPSDDDWIPPMPSVQTRGVDRHAAACQESFPVRGPQLPAKGPRGGLHIFPRTPADQETHPRALPQRHRMGRRHLRCRGRVTGLFQKVRLRPDPRRSRVPVSDDPEPAEHLQPAQKPQTRRPPPESDTPRNELDPTGLFR